MSMPLLSKLLCNFCDNKMLIFNVLYEYRKLFSIYKQVIIIGDSLNRK